MAKSKFVVILLWLTSLVFAWMFSRAYYASKPSDSGYFRFWTRDVAYQLDDTERGVIFDVPQHGFVLLRFSHNSYSCIIYDDTHVPILTASFVEGKREPHYFQYSFEDGSGYSFIYYNTNGTVELQEFLDEGVEKLDFFRDQLVIDR